ncbi:FCD domain-containing protein [Tardiphaga sp.]|uniref:FCD domain-containing protein n=1 Tax=Tardiphaga sp. TaxID=1926292 RepID=UPI0026226EDC|nr:FCD domain-containing protein [Tardiphaga sp.]
MKPVLSRICIEVSLTLRRFSACNNVRLHFHRSIHEAARNQYLTSALGQLADSLSLLPGTTFEAPGRAAVASNEHRDIIAAIRKHDGARAEAAARSHIAKACDTRISMMFRS